MKISHLHMADYSWLEVCFLLTLLRLLVKRKKINHRKRRVTIQNLRVEVYLTFLIRLLLDKAAPHCLEVEEDQVCLAGAEALNFSQL